MPTSGMPTESAVVPMSGSFNASSEDVDGEVRTGHVHSIVILARPELERLRIVWLVTARITPVEVDRFRWNADLDDVYCCLGRLLLFRGGCW